MENIENDKNKGRGESMEQDIKDLEGVAN